MDMDPSNFLAFFEGFKECVLWVEEESLPVGFSWDDVSQVKQEEARQDCEQFVASNYGVLWQVSEDSGTSWQQHGCDFNLTRNRHGAGFWDRGYGLLGDYLAKQSKTYGEFDLFAYYEGES